MLKIRHNLFIWIIAAVLVSLIFLVLFLRSDVLYQRLGQMQQKPEKKIEIVTSNEQPARGQKLHLYYVSAEKAVGRQIQDHLMKAMEYSHIHFEIIQQLSSITPSPYTGIILSGEDSQRIQREEIEYFVKAGGRLIVPYRFNTDSSWDSLFGISKKQDFKEVKGLYFEKSLFPGYPDIPNSSNLLLHSSLNVELNQATTKTWITSENLPILWESKYGKGEVLYWNTTVMDDKLGRGLFVQSLGLVFPAFVSAQLGVQLMYIDDFPAPIPNGKLKNVIKRPISLQDFYQNFWWKDMKKIAEDYEIKYTGVAIGTYQRDVTPPFPNLSTDERNTYLYYGWEMFSIGGEIGLHGFNHQPLLTKEDPVDKKLGYTGWKSQKDMEQSIIDLQNLVHHFFPKNKFETYVPPSNVLNRTGLDSLSNAAPELRTIAGLYFSTNANSTFITEFEEDYKHKNLYFFPRITSGYVLSLEDQFAMADVAANFGVVSHFVHPDDILDSERSVNQTWSELSNSYRKITEKVRKWYPHIESVTQSEATELIKLYQAGDLITTYSDNMINIAYKGLPANASAFVRVEEGKSLETGTFSFGTVTKIADQLYNVRLNKPQAEISIKGEALQ